MSHFLLLLVLLQCAPAQPAMAAPGRQQRPPARRPTPTAGLPVASPPRRQAAAPAAALPPRASAAYSQVLNVTMASTWFTGVALLNDSSYYLSGGNWYAGPPYPFSVYSFSLAAGAPAAPVAAYPSAPGSVWPSGGAQPAALFSGMSFTTDGAVYAAYGGGAGQEGPLWVESVPGVSGNWWETSAPIQASRNGSIVAYALTAMDRYDPLGPKHAEVVVLDTGAWPARVLLRDQLANGTGVEDVHLSADGATLVLIAAWDPSGAINSSLVRVYDVASGSALASFSTGYIDAACLSADGALLVLATCDSDNAIEVYAIAGGAVTQTANSTYPSGLPAASTFTYAETCQVTAAGGLFVVFPLWWGGSINQTAVAYWRSLPAAPTQQPALPPSALWLSPGVSPSLQDSVIASATAGPFFGYSSWGGRAVAPGQPPPPTLHLFSEAAPGAPLLEIGTPASDDPTVSGSAQSLDLAWNGTALLLLCEGLDNVRVRGGWRAASPPPLLPGSALGAALQRTLLTHTHTPTRPATDVQHANIGSSGGIAYLFAITP